MEATKKLTQYRIEISESRTGEFNRQSHMNLAWISDPHLEFVRDQNAREFVESVAAQTPDAMLITGDISTSYHLAKHLAILAKLSCDVYFVLGNHDFYESNFAAVQEMVADVCQRHSNLHQLGHGEILRLTETTSLIGHIGWADGRAGNGARSNARMNDHLLIQNLVRRDSGELFAILNRLGEQSAEYILKVGETAIESCGRLIVATHVPPFAEAAFYKGRPSEPEFAPHFVNVAMGNSLMTLATNHPDNLSWFSAATLITLPATHLYQTWMFEFPRVNTTNHGSRKLSDSDVATLAHQTAHAISLR